MDDMLYNLTRRELKEKNGIDFKQGDVIRVGNFEIEINYGGYDIPSLCSRVFDLNKMKYQDVVFRQAYISNFLHKHKEVAQ